MTGPTRTDWRARLVFTGSAAALALIALATMSPPAQARVWIGLGVPFPGYYYGPGPYYGYPPPYAYAPPPSYYPPPDYYPAPGAYPPSAYPQAAPAPSAYAPQEPTPAYPPAAGAAAGPTSMATPANPGSPAIIYTNKPAFTNAAGQTCREYKATDATAGRDVFGTACKQPDGQWRVAN